MNERKIIDFHWHIIEPVKTMKKVMERNGIIQIVGIPFDLGGLSWSQAIKMVGMNPKPMEYQKAILKRLPEINNDAYKLVMKEKEIIFGEWVSPTGELMTNIHPQIAKIIPPFDHVSESYYTELGNLIAKLQHPIIMIHTGWGSSIAPLGTLIEQFPKKKFVLAHLKEDFDIDNLNRIAIMKKFSNVYLELSYLSSPKRLGQYVKMGFGDRILFGSDFRTLEDEPTLKWMINAVEVAEISDQDREKIWFENAERLLNETNL